MERAKEAVQLNGTHAPDDVAQDHARAAIHDENFQQPSHALAQAAP